MMDKKSQQEILAYFRQPAFHRVMDGFRERYCSLGHTGGSVVLKNPKEYERDGLEGFLQVNCHKQKSITVSVKGFETALGKSKFAGITLDELLKLYFGGSLVSKKEEKARRETLRQDHFMDVVLGQEHTVAGKWYQKVIDEKCPPYTGFLKMEKEGAEVFQRDIAQLLKALNTLPVWKKEKMRLPVFAALITGNPHAYDENSRMHRYLLYGICGVLGLDIQTNTAEGRAELLYAAGILKDDISNSVTCYGIRGILPDGRYHPGMEGYFRSRELMQLTLSHLGKLENLKIEKEQVYVVENPSVFQYLLEQGAFAGETLVCSNGQLRIAVLVLLDLLVRSGARLYYAGDFDPEGLQIAQQLKNRYAEKLQLWHYDREDFDAACILAGDLSKRRKGKLKQLTDSKLLEMAQWIRTEHKLGYQENMLERYVCQS